MRDEKKENKLKQTTTKERKKERKQDSVMNVLKGASIASE